MKPPTLCEECGCTSQYGLRICKRCREKDLRRFTLSLRHFKVTVRPGKGVFARPPPESKALDQIWIHSQRRHPPKSREEFKMTGDYDAKRFTEGLVRIANKYGYRMKQFISPTHRVLVNDADETLEIEFLEG